MDKTEELKELVRRLRKVAAPIGEMHSYWDVIFDIEAHLEGRPTILKYDTNGWIILAESLLEGH